MTRSDDAARVVVVDAAWFPGLVPGDVTLSPTAFLATRSGLRTDSGSGVEPLHLPGTLLPPFTDAHVHLGLVDASALVPHGIAAVHDLGWIPEEAAAWAARAVDAEADAEAASEAARSGRGVGPTGAAGAARLPQVAFAGAFLTAPGGYPSGRSWAPEGSVEEVASPQEAVAAVDRQLDVGASFVKVALNTVAGPVPDDATLAAIVGRAHERGATVVAHAEGAGQAARAFAAGVDRLAHAPFSEPLPDALLRAMAGRSAEHLVDRSTGATGVDRSTGATGAGRGKGRAASGMTWVSTLDIHGYGTPTPQQDVAIDNARRFAAVGGTVVYGTDLGNGPLPVGVNPRELTALAAAGLDPHALLRALSPGSDPERCTPGRGMHVDLHHSDAGASLGAVTYVPGRPPDGLARLDMLDDGDALAELTCWLAGATTLRCADLLDPALAPPSGSTTRKEQP